MKVLAFLLFVAFAFVQANNDDLEGSKVYNVRPVTKKDFLVVQGLQDHIPGLDVWQYAHVLGREAKMLVPRESLVLFESVLKAANVNFDILMEDPKTVLENEMKANEFARASRGNEKISFTSYNRHAEINAYLDDLAARFPSRVKVSTGGRTVNGRDIKVITISSTGGNDPSKPIIVSDGGIHAREWIAPSTALYMIYKLVEDITESDVANNVDWIIIPSLNPDGYEYSHTNTRLWRKTRSTASSSTCPGVDGNRNFDFKWMQSGSSSNPCSDIFAGPRAFSEIETQVLRNVINENKARVKAYMAIHSYGSYFLYPYGYDGSNPPNVNELHSLGVQVANTIDSLAAPGSTKYLVGNSATALNYAAAGASDDWAMGVGGVSLAYTLELPGGGSAGFDLPPSRINQVVRETWGGIVVFARYVINKAAREGMYGQD